MRACVYGFLAGLTLLTLSGAANAVVIPNTVLGAARSDVYFGLILQSNVRTSDTVGTLDISGTAGCGSKCVATTGLGSSPFIDLYVSEVYDPLAGGGYARAVLYYFVQYNNPTPGPVDVLLRASDVLEVSSGSYGQTNLAFGPAFDRAGSFTFGSLILDATHCANACSSGFGANVDGGPIGTYAVSMEANTPYLVRLIANISPYNDGSISHALIDPTFSTTATGGTFVFSEGVTDGTSVPEPSTAAMLLGGSALVWFRRRTLGRPARA